MERVLTYEDIVTMLKDEMFVHVVPTMKGLYNSAKAMLGNRKRGCSKCRKRLYSSRRMLVSKFTEALFTADDNTKQGILTFWKQKDSRITSIVVYHIDNNQRIHTIKIGSKDGELQNTITS